MLFNTNTYLVVSDRMSDIRHSFAVKREIDEKFREIMDYFGTENKTDVFQRMTDQFLDLVWKAERYDKVVQDVLAYEILKKYKDGELTTCDGHGGDDSAEGQSQP